MVAILSRGRWVNDGKFCVAGLNSRMCCLVPLVDYKAADQVLPRGETTHEGVDISNTHPTIINTDYNRMQTFLILNHQYSAYQKEIKAWIESNRNPRCHVTT